MSKQEKAVAFGEDFWREEGGDEWAELIDEIEPALTPFSDRLIEQLSLDEGKVLDIGCGGGLTSIDTANKLGKNVHVLGADISPQILAIAKQRVTDIDNVEFSICDVGKDDLGEAVFDLIISRFGVMFFENPVAAFSNIKRSLKPGGELAVICWRTLKDNQWMGEPMKAVLEILPPKEKPPEKPDPDAPGPFSLGEAERINHVLENAGFKDITLTPVDIGMPMGSVEQALGFLTKMGPAAGLLADATDEQKAAGAEAIKAVLEKFDSAEGVVMPSAAWLVSATC